LDTVETDAEDSNRTRLGPTAGALISEVAARVAELARTIHDLERLVQSPEPVRGAQSRPERDEAAADRAHTGARDGKRDEARDDGREDARDEAGFSLFVEESNLTKREAEVLRHLLDGHSNRRISRSLRISESTVKNHLHAIFVKLDTRDRTQVVAKAYRFMADHSAQPARARHPPEDPQRSDAQSSD
jgi:DNA-binding NarL/FixJ family response regulator